MQLPVPGIDSLSIEDKEAVAFALALFTEVLAATWERFYETIVGDDKFPVATPFIKGAAAAAIALRARSMRQGKN